MKKILLSTLLFCTSLCFAVNDNLGLKYLYNLFPSTTPIYYSIDGGNWVEVSGYQKKAMGTPGVSDFTLVTKSFQVETATSLLLDVQDTHKKLNGYTVTTVYSAYSNLKQCYLLVVSDTLGDKFPVLFNAIVSKTPNVQIYDDGYAAGSPYQLLVLDTTDSNCASFFTQPEPFIKPLKAKKK